MLETSQGILYGGFATDSSEDVTAMSPLNGAIEWALHGSHSDTYVGFSLGVDDTLYFAEGTVLHAVASGLDRRTALPCAALELVPDRTGMFVLCANEIDRLDSLLHLQWKVILSNKLLASVYPCNAVTLGGDLVVETVDRHLRELRGTDGGSRFDVDIAHPIASGPIIGMDGSILVMIQVQGALGIRGFDPDDGKTRFASAVGGSMLGGVAVAPDGTILIARPGADYLGFTATGQPRFAVVLDTVGPPSVAANNLSYVQLGGDGTIAIVDTAGSVRSIYTEYRIHNTTVSPIVLGVGGAVTAPNLNFTWEFESWRYGG